jgi:hypothetical protein
MERPAWFLNEWYWRHTCSQIVACADDLLADRLGVIAASRLLFPLVHEVRASADPDFNLFVLIYSESDALPVGSERSTWSTAALEREDVKIAGFEARWREAAHSAAGRLRDKYAVV